MPAGFQDAYHSLERAQECLARARGETDSMEQSAHLKIAYHAMCQAARLAHRCYEVGAYSSGSMGGGTQTWAKNELEDFMSIPFRDFSMRRALSFEDEEKDCEMWLKRAKFFVDKLAAESSNVARRVDESRVEWDVRNGGKRRKWDEQNNMIIERNDE